MSGTSSPITRGRVAHCRGGCAASRTEHGKTDNPGTSYADGSCTNRNAGAPSVFRPERKFLCKTPCCSQTGRKNPGGFEPDGKALARAFNHADPAGREKPVRRILRQPCRRVTLLRIYPACGTAHRIHGLFRGAARCMPCIPFRPMASLPPGWFHCMDPGDRAQQSPFACIQHRLFDPALGPRSSSGIPSSGHVFEAPVLGPGNALSIIPSTGWRPLWTPGRLREPAARPATGSSPK